MDSIEGRYVAEDGTYTLGTHTISADEFELNGLANHALSQSDSKGPYMAMYYHGGTYDANSRTFTTNATNVADGPDWRQSVLYYLDPA